MVGKMVPPGIITEAAHAQAPELRARSFLIAPPQESLWLPPREYWQLPDEPLETPVDERGLVEVATLIELVKGTVDPAYAWQRSDSTHHFYWPEAHYSYGDVWMDAGKTYSSGRFRDLPINKGELPREFENWLHIVTRPPAAPNKEVMQYYVEAWRVAVNLFSSVRRVVLWEKRAEKRARFAERNPGVVSYDEGDVYGREYMAEIIEKKFRGVERHMNDLQRVPQEFRLVEPTDSPRELATRLGEFVGRRSMKLRRLVSDGETLPAAA